jgi:F-type H+-transporting ATPase subunit delta
MNHSKINVRYAKALFSLGKENDQIKSLHKDIMSIYTLCSESADFVHFLENPIISTSQKKEIFQELFKDRLSELALRFILLVTENHREVEIPGICRHFIDLVRADLGILPASVTTTGQLSRATFEQIRESLIKETGKEIELTEKINPLIIGGMILRIEDQQYDGSIATQLKKIRTAMLAK